MVDPAAVAALVPLFALYCGGLSREPQLRAALQTLSVGSLRGSRRLHDSGAHHFELRWSGEPAPMESLRCQLRFPDFPTVQYDFSLPCHQLVIWLMESAGHGLPESFWPWLLQGRLAGARP